MSPSRPALAAALAIASSCAADTTIDTFEDGDNEGGWTISGAGVVENAGGNPDAWLHRNNLFTFAPIVASQSTASPFIGDFRAMRVTQLCVDAQLLFRDFGNPVGFEMSLVLRDTKGTPGNPDDDDYAYFVGPNVPLMGDGWKSFTFDVPSQSVDAVPAGWSGGWAGDPENFRPGVDWNDVITNVDRVEFWWIHPAFFAIIASWDVGVDNICITSDDATPCPGDGDGSGTIDVVDLLGLLGVWGTDDPTYDIAPEGGDGVVSVNDLLTLLGLWGPCPG